MRALWLVVTVAAFAPLVAADPAAPPPDQRVLARVNAYRAHAGLAPVALDAKLSTGCTQHAQYMKLNRGTDAMAGLNPHHERPELPGASPAGATCGENADLYPEVGDLDHAVDDWAASLYHRRPMLDPQLTKIGFGYATISDGLYTAALMFAPADEGSAGWPVRYPADKQTDVGLELSNEYPPPAPGGHGGYPITIQFPAFDPVTKVSATLVDGAGKAVPFYLSDPEQPASSFGQYGVVCLIAKAALRPSTTYAVSVDATWKARRATYAWSFTTIGLRAVDADDETAVMAARGVASRVHGTVAYGGMMDADTAYLALGHADPKHYKMLSVIVPIAVWHALAGNVSPAKWAGKTLDVEATPELVDGVYLNLAIGGAAQVTVSAGSGSGAR